MLGYIHNNQAFIMELAENGSLEQYLRAQKVAIRKSNELLLLLLLLFFVLLYLLLLSY